MKSKTIIVVLKCKKVALFEKIEKMSSLFLWFTKIPKIFIFVRIRHVAFLSEDWKELRLWRSVLFTVLALARLEREAYRKQTGSYVSVFLKTVCTLEYDRSMQVSPYIVSWLFANT